ncbi:MAG: hypothetical protein OXH86_12530 [Acidimicrobiaceae bacterium]|nr:hypothetical protein [Acidimicrobiaceae bacterium]
MATQPDFVFDEHVPSGGVHANSARVWHTRHEFTVDFLAPWLHPSHDDDSLLIVARVRIPSTAMFGIVQGMSNGIGEYELEHGRLTPPPMEAS